MNFTPAIGMLTINRSIEASCVHATEYCRRTCYNNRVYAMYPNVRKADPKIEAEWDALTGKSLSTMLKFDRHKTERLRLMGRGEALATHADVDKVADLTAACPDTLFWLPTRAWRGDSLLRARVEVELLDVGNLCILASTDPSNTFEEWEDLMLSGWSVMHYGDNARPIWGDDPRAHAMRCPKSWRKLKGHCAVCKAGCFAPRVLGRRVDVWLKKH